MAGTKASSVDHVINMARLYTLVEWTFESKRGVEPLVFHLLCNYDHHVIFEEKERERAEIFLRAAPICLQNYDKTSLERISGSTNLQCREVANFHEALREKAMHN